MIDKTREEQNSLDVLLYVLVFNSFYPKSFVILFDLQSGSQMTFLGGDVVRNT